MSQTKTGKRSFADELILLLHIANIYILKLSGTIELPNESQATPKSLSPSKLCRMQYVVFDRLESVLSTMKDQRDVEAWQQVVHQALKSLGKRTVEQTPLSDLYLVRRALEAVDGNVEEALYQTLQDILEAITATDQSSGDILRQQFFEGKMARTVAAQQDISISNYFRRQKQALNLFTETLLQRSQTAQTVQLEKMLARLETARQQPLLAIHEQLSTLLSLVAPDSPHWLIALTGIGGIGKTSLADATLRHALDIGLWHNIAWVTARQVNFNLGGSVQASRQAALTTDTLVEQLFEQLFGHQSERLSIVAMRNQVMEKLHRVPHLVVIDNLEDVTDLTNLLPLVRELVKPSKVLFTTREGLYGEPDIAHRAVVELSETDAIALVRQEANVRLLDHVAAATDDQLQPIYATVGGNPLALRLVVGHLHVFALASVLEDMRAKRGEAINNLYRFIYRKAWDGLDENERHVLLTMLVVPESGATIEFLETILTVATTDFPDGLNLNDLRKALNHLVTISLIDRHGSLNRAQYTIHNLTRTFLHEVIDW